MSKKHPLTPEEIQAIADAVAKQIAPKHPLPVPSYYGPYISPYIGQRYGWTVNSAGPGNQA